MTDFLDKEFGTLSDLLRHHAARQPNHAAICCDGQVLDYAALDEWMDRMAATLQREGLGPGDVVAISSANSMAYAVAFLGSLRAGVAVAPLAPDMTADTLLAMVADSGARRLFLDQRVAQTLEPVRHRLGLPLVALDGSSAGEPWQAWLSAPGAEPRAVDVAPDAMFNIIYSSGTTGMPKGIVHSHRFRWEQFKLFRPQGYGSESVVMASLPLYSNMTLSGFLPSLALGSTIVLMSRFDARGFLQLSERYRVTHAMMVPVQFQRILAWPDFDQYDLSSYRVKSCASAAFAATLKQEVLSRWPGELIEYYGMTEGAGVCVLDTRRYPDKLHTVGHPVPGHDMRVIDEAGRELPPGATGEIVGRSPTMMLGYHNQSQMTREVEWFDAQGNRFIRSGDVGYFDQDGFLVLMDRAKDMIISGGFNVYPSDVEAVLRGHPEVAEVSVTGVPSARWGESPIAFVVRRADAALTAEQLMDWSQTRLNKAQRLAVVEFVDELPRNGIGKVLKRTLRDRWLASGRTL